jgi:Spy/CpxP family protein refolding chaperone
MTDRPRALAVLISVFLLGCILGAIGANLWSKKNLASPRAGMTNALSGHGQEQQRLQEILKLTPDQEARFREIMAESRMQLEGLRAEQAPKIEAIRGETNRKLESILNEEQRKKFKDFLAEMGKRRERNTRTRGFERR